MLYDIAFLMFSVFYLPALFFKGKMHGEFRERLGLYDKAKRNKLVSGSKTIWVQAVSVGEVSLCKSLIPRLRQRYPDRSIVISTITKTGNDLAKRLFGKDAVVIYFPLDFSLTAGRAVSAIRPEIYIMIETEIWPNVLKALSARSVPSILLNGRISDRSFGKYMLARVFLRKTLERIAVFCMQSVTDAERIVSIGAERNKVHVTGNMKFDAEIKTDDGVVLDMRSLLELRASDSLVVAGSTHSGEELALVGAYKKLAGDFPALKLLIAPRHIERTGEVARIVLDAGFPPVLISDLRSRGLPVPNGRVFILDEIGCLNAAYALASVVFIGGSLVRHGGQNPIEPAALARPILFGPYMFNFKNIQAAFLANNAALQVSGGSEICDVIGRLLRDAKRRNDLGANAEKVVRENRGATNRNMDSISWLIG